MARKKQGGGRTTPKKASTPEPSSPFDSQSGLGSPLGFDAAAMSDGEFDEGDLELFRSIRMSIDANPIELLGLASSFVDSNDARTASIFDPSGDDESDEVMEQLLELAGLEARETDALAMAVASLLPRADALAQVRERIGATEWLPTWLRKIDEAVVDDAFELTDVLGDADQLSFEVRFPGGKAFCLVILIDNNQGMVVTDGFAVPLSIDELADVIDQGVDDGMTRQPLDRAAGRARLAKAIEMGFNTVPPFETETWPDIRPLTEWMMRLLPEGGVAPIAEPLTRAAAAELTNDFLASADGADLSDTQVELVEHLLAFKGGSGNLDPLRWSEMSVELFFADWAPRTLELSDEQWAELPDVLKAFIHFAYDKLGNVPDTDAEETMAAIDHWSVQRR